MVQRRILKVLALMSDPFAKILVLGISLTVGWHIGSFHAVSRLKITSRLSLRVQAKQRLSSCFRRPLSKGALMRR